jgi:hypothetical protein
VATFIDAWKLIHDELKARRETEKKRKAFGKLTGKTLDMQMLESIAQEAAKLRPGFYTRVTIEGAVIEMGVKENAKPMPRQENETF